MLYEMNGENLTGIERTSFKARGILEGTLQEALRKNPEYVEDGLFVISDEFSDWADSGRSIDLLCIDSDGNVVVVELKRADGAHMELQAIRYAAMMANSSTDRIIEGHRRYLRDRSESAEGSVRSGFGSILTWRLRRKSQSRLSIRESCSSPRILIGRSRRQFCG